MSCPLHLVVYESYSDKQHCLKLWRHIENGSTMHKEGEKLTIGTLRVAIFPDGDNNTCFKLRRVSVTRIPMCRRHLLPPTVTECQYTLNIVHNL